MTHRKPYKQNGIKNVLQEMRLALYHAGMKDCDYHISQRGVPYVHVVIDGQRYQFSYFGRGDFFRVFDKDQRRKDFATKEEVISYFITLNGGMK
jgi:hypothetical protein